MRESLREAFGGPEAAWRYEPDVGLVGVASKGCVAGSDVPFFFLHTAFGGPEAAWRYEPDVGLVGVASKGCVAGSDVPSLLLPTAFVLSVCFFSTEAYYKRTNITVEPPMPMEGGSVRLTPVTLTIAQVFCRWFRGEMRRNETILTAFFYPRFKVKKGPNFTGRETIRPDCSLEITPLNITDLANYITLIEGPEDMRIGSVELIVHCRL
nr:carcinoembryonic antigen-related cell adhesion molecule 5-like [Anolis sagrei ordinatus]